jgi:uncharacterized protein (DUF433 family)
MNASTSQTMPASWRRSPDVLGGELVFAGTRVLVRSLVDHLEGGNSLDDFLESFPSVTRAQAVAVLARCWQAAADESVA